MFASWINDSLICFNFGFIVISTIAAIYWARRLMRHIFKKMIKDFNLEEMMGEPEDHAAGASDSHSQAAGCKLYRGGIAAAISGGNAKNLLERAVTHDELSHITPGEINTLYAEYTA